jgi:hypothetical protein
MKKLKTKKCANSNCDESFDIKNDTKKYCCLPCKNQANYKYHKEVYSWEVKMLKARNKNIQILEYCWKNKMFTLQVTNEMPLTRLKRLIEAQTELPADWQIIKFQKLTQVDTWLIGNDLTLQELGISSDCVIRVHSFEEIQFKEWTRHHTGRDTWWFLKKYDGLFESKRAIEAAHRSPTI